MNSGVSEYARGFSGFNWNSMRKTPRNYTDISILPPGAREALPLIKEVYLAGDAGEIAATLDDVFEELGV